MVGATDLVVVVVASHVLTVAEAAAPAMNIIVVFILIELLVFRFFERVTGVRADKLELAS